MVDADHGYGNALNVKRTVEELETAGVGGLSIEDTDLPTPFGTAKPRLTSIAEGVGKMKAALAGRQDPALCIAGRTSAIQITGLDDAIARGKAYEAAGVDALFFVGVHDARRARCDLGRDHAAADPGRRVAASSPTCAISARRRVRIALQGHQPFAAAVKAIHDTLKALRDGTPPGKLHRHRRRRADEARDARRGLHEVDEGVPGRIGARSKIPIVSTPDWSADRAREILDEVLYTLSFRGRGLPSHWTARSPSARSRRE